MTPPRRGAKYVTGTLTAGRLVLTREDGTVHQTPSVFMFTGVAITDNEDGTATFTFDEE